MRSTSRLSATLALAGATLIGIAGCATKDSPGVAKSASALTSASPSATTSATGSASASATSSASPAADACPKGQLPTRTTGTLTVGTDNPAYEPWFSDNKPANGKGFESAVAYAVAKQLGYDTISWTVASFNTVVAPGPKKFDFDVNEVSITPARMKAVDFSSGYYAVTQTLIALKSSPIAKATSIADLKNAKLGAQVGTTSYSTITDVIKPSKAPSAFDNNDIAKAALKNGQIDGIIVDLPTAFYITGAEIPTATIVGQFANADNANGEQFGLVLDKGSKLTPCVTGAVDALRADGTLQQLADKWLAKSAGAPVLK